MAELTLSLLKAGQPARVQRVEGAPEVRRRLQEMGLIRGAPVTFVRAAPLGDPLEFRVRNCHLSLRRQDAEGVIVDV